MTINQAGEFKRIDTLFDRLFPICRSITGPGFRQSLELIKEHVPFEDMVFKSGSKVFDWEVPPEWSISEAYLTDPDGKKVVDFKDSNLHVVNFSEPIDRELDLEELLPHLHSIPHLPSAIPYVTSYYKRTWGFCLSDDVKRRLKPGRYHAVIKSKIEPGHVTVGETALAGISRKEVLLSTYLCHPSLANNELSGPLVQCLLYERIKKWPRRNLTYRFVILPETIGSICYLSRRGDHLKQNLVSGLVLTCLGGRNPSLSFKQSRADHALINRLVDHLNLSGFEKITIRPFQPNEGSDERQFCSPGFNLPVGQFARDVYGHYDGYHNSLDTKEFMQISSLIDSVDCLERILLDLDSSVKFVNQSPFGEVQLGRRGLYPNMNSHHTRSSSTDAHADGREQLNRILYVLNYSDGQHDHLDIAEKMKIRPSDLRSATAVLQDGGLLKFHEEV